MREIVLNTAAGTRAAGIVHSLTAVDESLEEHLHTLVVVLEESLCAVYASAERLTRELGDLFAVIFAVDEVRESPFADADVLCEHIAETRLSHMDRRAVENIDIADDDVGRLCGNGDLDALDSH